MEGAVYVIQRMLQRNSEHYLWLDMLAPTLSMNEYGAWFITQSLSSSSRMMSLSNGSDITPVYTVPQPDNSVAIIVKY